MRTVTRGIAHGLLDRNAECEVFDRLLKCVRGGHSSVLVVRGELGIGKTAHAIDSAAGFRVVWVTGSSRRWNWYEDALIAAQQASDDSNNLRYAAWPLAELVEAASRAGHHERGAQALRRLTAITRAGGSQ